MAQLEHDLTPALTLEALQQVPEVTWVDPRESTRQQTARTLGNRTVKYYEDESWRTNSLCADTDPETFFPSDGAGVEVARKICAECPVKDPCLEFALSTRQNHGVWGGTSERERRRILKLRRNV